MDINNILLLHGQIREKEKKAKIYGVAIDLTNSNPNTSVVYTDDAVTMLGGTAWDNVFPFNQIVPVLLNTNGIETAQLDKNDFTKNVNGNPVNITSGDNVMIKIPKIWYKIETVSNYLYCKISSEQVDETYKCYAHYDGLSEHDALYIGAYLAFDNSGVLKSWSGRLPTNSISLSNSRTRARANGFRYNLLGFYQLTLLQVLMLIRAKSLEAYSAYGYGYVEADSATMTGGTNNIGMYSRGTSNTEQVKILGVEDFYGNLRYFIDGIKTDANYDLLLTKNPSLYSNDATGYEKYETPFTSIVEEYIKTPFGDMDRGFIIKEGNASDRTYFASGGHVHASSFPRFGSVYNSGPTGMFALRISSSGSSSSSAGARIMYL